MCVCVCVCVCVFSDTMDLNAPNVITLLAAGVTSLMPMKMESQTWLVAIGVCCVALVIGMDDIRLIGSRTSKCFGAHLAFAVVFDVLMMRSVAHQYRCSGGCTVCLRMSLLE